MKFKFFILFFFLFFFSDVISQESRIKKFKQLSCPEKTWVIFHPFVALKALKISEETRKETEIIKEGNILNGSGNGGVVDAFRHAFWMATLTKEIGWRRAKSLGSAHEKGNFKTYKKGKLEDGVLPDKISSEMDFFNNAIGIRIGKMSDTLNLRKKVIEAVKEGRCMIIRKDKKGNFVDCNGGRISIEETIGKWENEKCLVKSNFNP